MSLKKQKFAEYHSADVIKYTLTNSSGAYVEILNYGGTVLKISVPDKNGNLGNVVCGYRDFDACLEADGYKGALIGRVGNRICKGKFTLDGTEYILATNDGPNHLHGGKYGFDKKIWAVLAEDASDEPSVKLYLLSHDGEEGYPGNLGVSVTYKWSNKNELSIRYEAVTDKRTPINLTNHTYFNLRGAESGKIYDHIMQIDADTYLPTDSTLIPTGEIRSVEGTPFDFRIPKKIGQDIKKSAADLLTAGGYDHCFNFTDYATSTGIKRRIKVYEEQSGRAMEVYTDQPGVQFYSGNFMGDRQTAFCLETQHMPDAVNQENFTNVIISPEEKYDYTTVYKFSVENK